MAFLAALVENKCLTNQNNPDTTPHITLYNNDNNVPQNVAIKVCSDAFKAIKTLKEAKTYKHSNDKLEEFGIWWCAAPVLNKHYGELNIKIDQAQIKPHISLMRRANTPKGKCSTETKGEYFSKKDLFIKDCLHTGQFQNQNPQFVNSFCNEKECIKYLMGQQQALFVNEQSLSFSLKILINGCDVEVNNVNLVPVSEKDDCSRDGDSHLWQCDIKQIATGNYININVNKNNVKKIVVSDSQISILNADLQVAEDQPQSNPFPFEGRTVDIEVNDVCLVGDSVEHIEL